MSSIVKKRPRRRKLPAKLKEQAERLRDMPDEAIDYSDIPATDQAFWANAEVVEPSGKTRITIRIDDDVLDWYRKHAKRYQTLMNAVLKAYKEARDAESG